MAVTQVPFRFNGGVSIDGVRVLSGAEAPGGTSLTDGAGVGSGYFDTTNGFLYTKDNPGAGTNKWVKATTQDDLDAAQLGESWREPALVLDATTYADIAAAESAADVANTVDSVAILSGSRILFTNLTTGPANIYIVSGLAGAWTFTESGNSASRGDAVFVQEGSSAGKQMAYNGTAWVQQGAASDTEIGYIRTFVGKTASGSETPDYSSTYVVADGDNLEISVGKLDAEIGDGVATLQSRATGPILDQAVNRNVEALDDAIGPDSTSTNVVSTGSVNVNIGLLDAAIGASVATPQSRATGPISIQAVNLNVKALDDAIGPDVTSTEHATAADSVNANISVIDSELGKASKRFTESAVFAPTVITSDLVDNYQTIRWMVTAQSVGSPANVYSAIVLAMHDGSAGVDAVNAAYSVSNELVPNTMPTGLDFSVDLSGAGGSQVFQLKCVSTDSVNVSAVRMSL